MEKMLGPISVSSPLSVLILRSRLPGLHVGRVAQRFGGGGHPTAASARISGAMPVEVREQLLDILAIEMPPPATAIDIAGRTIFSIDDANSVEETKDRINKLRVNALPVREAATGELVGLVTRQILDRATLFAGVKERDFLPRRQIGKNRMRGGVGFIPEHMFDLAAHPQMRHHMLKAQLAVKVGPANAHPFPGEEMRSEDRRVGKG